MGHRWELAARLSPLILFIQDFQTRSLLEISRKLASRKNIFNKEMTVSELDAFEHVFLGFCELTVIYYHIKVNVKICSILEPDRKLYFYCMRKE